MRFGILMITIMILGGITIGISYAITEVGGGDDISIPATKRIFLDGGGDTYFHEPTANSLEFVEGGGTSSGIAGLALNNVFTGTINTFDRNADGFDALRFKGADNNEYLFFKVDGTNNEGIIGYWDGTGLGNISIQSGHFIVDSSKRIFLDGGGDTYIREGVANEIDFYAGGTRVMNVGSDICIGNCP